MTGSPLMSKLLRLRFGQHQQRQGMGQRAPEPQLSPTTPHTFNDPIAYPPGMQEGQQYDDFNPYLQDESMMGTPYQEGRAMPVGMQGGQMNPYDMEQPMAGGYGPIGNRMERMRPTLVHDRKKVQGMFPKGIPEDVEGATQAMESADDEMGQINAHKKQHKFMKGHLKAGIGRIQAERGGESVDKMFQKLQSDLAKLKEQRAKRGK
jgi:hypothetical protein